MRKTKWIVQFFHGNKVDSECHFDTEAQAKEYYDGKIGAIRWGLVGWSVSFPKEVEVDCSAAEPELCDYCEGTGIRGHGGLLHSEDECTKCCGTGEKRARA